MKVSADGSTLFITINKREYDMIFIYYGGEQVDIYTDNDNMNIFFPNWKEYVDKNDVLPSLDVGEAMRFKKICFSFDDTVETKEGEGYHEIIDFMAIENIDDDGDIPTVGINDDMDGKVIFSFFFK